MFWNDNAIFHRITLGYGQSQIEFYQEYTCLKIYIILYPYKKKIAQYLSHHHRQMTFMPIHKIK